MSLYAYDGPLNVDELKAFCLVRKRESPAEAFYHVVIFDKKENAKFPRKFGVSHGFDDDETTHKHIRAVYCFNKLNGYSVVYYHEKNVWEHITTEMRVD